MPDSSSTMRIALMAVVALAARAGAQGITYHTVPVPHTDASAMGIEFTLPLDGALAGQRIRDAATRKKFDFYPAEEGRIPVGKTQPGPCDMSRAPFLAPGTRAPTGPCHITIAVDYRSDSAGTTFLLSGYALMRLPGSDAATGEWLQPRSRHWALLRNLAKAIAEP